MKVYITYVASTYDKEKVQSELLEYLNKYNVEVDGGIALRSPRRLAVSKNIWEANFTPKVNFNLNADEFYSSCCQKGSKIKIVSDDYSLKRGSRFLTKISEFEKLIRLTLLEYFPSLEFDPSDYRSNQEDHKIAFLDLFELTEKSLFQPCSENYIYALLYNRVMNQLDYSEDPPELSFIAEEIKNATLWDEFVALGLKTHVRGGRDDKYPNSELAKMEFKLIRELRNASTHGRVVKIQEAKDATNAIVKYRRVITKIPERREKFARTALHLLTFKSEQFYSSNSKDL